MKTQQIKDIATDLEVPTHVIRHLAEKEKMDEDSIYDSCWLYYTTARLTEENKLDGFSAGHARSIAKKTMKKTRARFESGSDNVAKVGRGFIVWA